MSALFGLFEWTGVERCAQMNRRPNAACQMYGVEETAIATGLLALAGLALTAQSAVAARKARSLTGAG